MYYDCVCCGTTDMSDDTDERRCTACVLCDCGTDGDSPECRMLILDGARGIYLPQDFARDCDPAAWSIPQETTDILLAGPDHEHYWDAWDDVVGRHERVWDGKTWTLEQDGDLFAVCTGKA